ncbi:mtDNA inheritance, partitioning of the mitochondrial organelle [Apophysomyces ossiformis]|uniref:MtDNA inheritance, partitioning of the mitochondrial organelle n=1 Tax=Apophysomyces ossiformis TaxID=679940 RepID=A0A8H7ENN9_9FUNG|nr:mtDNA inheritance, partitioning of the mitochondrial organelle [Apophysomyces ossiformis]
MAMMTVNLINLITTFYIEQASRQREQGVSDAVGPRLTHPYQEQLDRTERDAMEVDAGEQLDRTVEVWSDFNRIFYHPRSINAIASHPINGLDDFDLYPAGREAFQENEKEMDTMDENFRFFAEECDQLQGFQLLTGIDDAFAGFATGLIDALRAEYPKTPIITYGLSDNNNTVSSHLATRRIINRAVGLAQLSEASSLYVPLYTPQSFRVNQPLVYPNEALLYHTSAILSAAIETASLPYRMKKKAWSLADGIAQLNGQGNTNLAMLATAFPLPFSDHGYDSRMNHSLYNLSTLTQAISISHPQVFSVNLLFFVVFLLLRGNGDRKEYINRIFSKFKEEIDPCHQRCVIDVAYPLAHSYPRFFSSSLNEQGYITDRPTLAPVQVPMMTHLFTADNLHSSLEAQVEELKQIQSKDLVEFGQGDFGLTREDYLETKESLITLSDAYRIDHDMM